MSQTDILDRYVQYRREWDRKAEEAREVLARARVVFTSEPHPDAAENYALLERIARGEA